MKPIPSDPGGGKLSYPGCSVTIDLSVPWYLSPVGMSVVSHDSVFGFGGIKDAAFSVDCNGGCVGTRSCVEWARWHLGSRVLLVCWERPQGVKPLRQPRHWEMVEGMVGMKVGTMLRRAS